MFQRSKRSLRLEDRVFASRILLKAPCVRGRRLANYHQESFWVIRIIENDVWIYRHQMSAQVSSEMLKLSETNLVVLGDCKQTITKSLETIQPQ